MINLDVKGFLNGLGAKCISEEEDASEEHKASSSNMNSLPGPASTSDGLGLNMQSLLSTLLQKSVHSLQRY
jgi:hypothetical protein